ncbi:MAG: Putative Glycerol-3-phosphate-binding periplasmic protein [Mesotoga prima]|uniref:Putative Glycerol-3-phosphate-binding periplasmic protein n=1 Tax=Mesotoga prima TaxID=1184387 RepID=A0A101HP34_9BACT|nr:MAG: Putative Glycerol-3-phosphate-binding periplasmic protein [Mesotoga prima]
MKRTFLIALLVVAVAAIGFAAPVKVTMWYAQTGIYSQTLLDIAAEFNELHKGEIEVEAVYTGNYQDTMQKLLAAMVAGDVPNLAQIEQSRIGQFVDGGAFQDLNYFIERDPEFAATLDDFWPRFIQANTYEQGLLGFPLNCSTPLMYINRDLFKQAGLDPDNPPKTWTEVYAAAKQIKTLGEDIFGYRFGSDDWLLEAYIWQFGGQIISEDGREMLIYSPETVAAWNFFQKGVREGIFIFGVSGGNELDLSGRIAMVVRSTGSLGYLKQNAKFDLGATTMPGQVKEVVPIGGANVFMFSARPQAEKDAAWEFLKFLTATENTKRWSLATGYMTSRISAFESPEIQQIMTDDPRFALTYKQLKDCAVRRPWYGPYPEVHAMITSAWEEVMSDTSKDVDAVLKNLQKEAQYVLDDYYF